MIPLQGTLFALTLTTLSLLPAAGSFAQEPGGPPPPPPPGGFRGPGGGPGRPGGFRPFPGGVMRREPSLANLPLQILEPALKLTGAQTEKVQQIRQAWMEEVRGLMPPPPPQGGFGRPGGGGGGGRPGGPPPNGGGPGGYAGGPGGPGGGAGGPEMRERMEKLRAGEKKVAEAVAAVLTAEQRRLAPQLIKDVPLLGQVGIPAPVWGDLKLTDAQRDRLEKIGKDHHPEANQAFREARESGDREAMMRIGRQQREAGHKAALAALTAEQRSLVEKWLKDHPRPTGPGGPGGPGFGGPGFGGPGRPGGPPPAP